jgi:hypothetical protein
MLAQDAESSIALSNIGFTLPKVGCGLICLTMSLRFFFGNNNYIYGVMTDNNRMPWQKFYQFSFIALQSIILLFSSYLIGQTRPFIQTIIALFMVETLWYGLTFLLDSKGVRNQKGNVDKEFFIAQLTNALFWLLSIILYWYESEREKVLVLGVLFLFSLNTAYDAWKNMPQYMGADS